MSRFTAASPLCRLPFIPRGTEGRKKDTISRVLRSGRHQRLRMAILTASHLSLSLSLLCFLLHPNNPRVFLLAERRNFANSRDRRTCVRARVYVFNAMRSSSLSLSPSSALHATDILRLSSRVTSAAAHLSRTLADAGRDEFCYLCHYRCLATAGRARKYYIRVLHRLLL